MALEKYIRTQLAEKKILLMTHIVLGYPSLDASYRIIQTMVKAGVDIMELQIPFSEPTADGPVIVKANQHAIDNGTTVEACMQLAGKAAKEFKIPFLIMTYYNVPYKYGIEKFTLRMKENNLMGTIIPDLPPEEGKDFLEAMNRVDIAPILIFSPTTTDERMSYLSSSTKGFIYCAARKGVTGKDTNFSEDLSAYLKRCRKATSLPIAVGFGIKHKEDVDFLKGKADIAVIGTQSIRVMEESGVDAVGAFIRGLR
ncbi:MAG: tryptophan synthase subunit alpha [Deltaproteobacteria bacterium]|nr:tryptophan synthase subunit alpha [Deltaproteobacteria bacterium]